MSERILVLCNMITVFEGSQKTSGRPVRSIHSKCLNYSKIKTGYANDP